MNGFSRSFCVFMAVVLVLFFVSGSSSADQLLAPESEAGDLDYFGTSVAIDANLAVVGVPAYSTNSSKPSRAYIFEKSDSGWAVLTTLQPGSELNDEGYGRAVAISGDTILVGARTTNITVDTTTYFDAGAVYIYIPDGSGGWLAQRLQAPDPGQNFWFGNSVAVDGDIAVVGCSRNGVDQAGAAYIYYRNSGGPGLWGLVKKITASDPASGDGFGTAVSVSGATVAISATGWEDDVHASGTGAVYLYERDFGGADNWGEITRIAPDNALNYLSFGYAVSLDADTLAVGVYGRAESYLYERDLGGTGNWGHRTTLAPSAGDFPGNTYGTALRLDGDLLIVGAYLDPSIYSGSGSAYFYYRHQNGTDAWGQIEKLYHPAPDVLDNQHFGYDVSISGNSLLVGADTDDFIDGASDADDHGAAYVFVPCGMLGGDVDEDDVCGDFDNCPEVANPEQEDFDEDGIGDACDEDADGDGENSALDCNDLDPAINTSVNEVCDDGIDNDCDGDTDAMDSDCLACLDTDGDGICDQDDNCPYVANPDQLDSDGDGIGDACESVVYDLAIGKLRVPNVARSCGKEKLVVVTVQNLGAETAVGDVTLMKNGEIVQAWDEVSFPIDASGRTDLVYNYSPVDDSGIVNWEACVSRLDDANPSNNCMTAISTINPCD